jgi:integrase
MSVRKRAWTNAKGETKEAWIVDYIDQHGKEHIKTFARKRDADIYHVKVRTEVREGRHSNSKSSATSPPATLRTVSTITATSLAGAV